MEELFNLIILYFKQHCRFQYHKLSRLNCEYLQFENFTRSFSNNKFINLPSIFAENVYKIYLESWIFSNYQKVKTGTVVVIKQSYLEAFKSKFINNSASLGGVFYSETEAVSNFTQWTLKWNFADKQGGVFYIRETCLFMLNNCLI